MSKKPDLAAAVRSAGGGTRYRERPEERIPVPAVQEEAKNHQQPGRQSTRPITTHFPKEVRDQLKILAVEQGKTMQDLVAEGFNDLFAKYGKPEIAPISKK